MCKRASSLRRLVAFLKPSERDTYIGRHDRNYDPEGAFTGTCQVREFTADGSFVGRCYFNTRNGRCPRHGSVVLYLGDMVDWPRDFELPKYNGQTWAENLRRERKYGDTK